MRYAKVTPVATVQRVMYLLSVSLTRIYVERRTFICCAHYVTTTGQLIMAITGNIVILVVHDLSRQLLLQL